MGKAVITTMSLRCAARLGVAHLAGSAVMLIRWAIGLEVRTLVGQVLGVVRSSADVRAAGNAPRRVRAVRPEWSERALAPLRSLGVRRGAQVVSQSGPSAWMATGRGWLSVEVEPGPASSHRLVIEDLQALVIRRGGARAVKVRTVSLLVLAGGVWVVLQRGVVCETHGRCGCSLLQAQVASGAAVRLVLTFDDVRGFRPRFLVRLAVQSVYEFSFTCGGVS